MHNKEITSFKNKTYELQKYVVDLVNGLNQVKTLVQTMRDMVLVLNSNTTKLIDHDVSRQQDLVGLHNKLSVTDKKIQDLQKKAEIIQNQTFTEVHEIIAGRTQNLTDSCAIVPQVKDRVEQLSESMNTSNIMLQEQIDNNDRKGIF